jgi:hypothetical protein
MDSVGPGRCSGHRCQTGLPIEIFTCISMQKSGVRRSTRSKRKSRDAPTFVSPSTKKTKADNTAKTAKTAKTKKTAKRKRSSDDKATNRVCVDVTREMGPFVKDLDVDPQLLQSDIARQQDITTVNALAARTSSNNPVPSHPPRLLSDIEELVSVCNELDNSISERYLTDDQLKRFRDTLLTIAARNETRKAKIGMIQQVNTQIVGLDDTNRNLTVCPTASSKGFLAKRVFVKELIGFVMKSACITWLETAWVPGSNASFSAFRQNVASMVQPLRTMLYNHSNAIGTLRYGPILLDAGHQIVAFMVFILSAGRLKYESYLERNVMSYNIINVQTHFFAHIGSKVPEMLRKLGASKMSEVSVLAVVSAAVLNTIRTHGTSLEFFGRRYLIHLASWVGPRAVGASIRVGGRLCQVSMSKVHRTINQLRGACVPKKIKSG